MSSKSVAIVGAGIAGLSAAATFAKAGFNVRVYEQAEEAREFGAALLIKHNAYTALKSLGITEKMELDGVRLQTASIVDDFSQQILQRDLRSEWAVMIRRQSLHSLLLQAALDNGVEVVVSARVVQVRAEGVLTFANGSEVSADLVIGADGRNSVVRDALGLTATAMDLPTGATRAAFPRKEIPVAMEYWSGSRRVGFAPCSEDLTYAFIMGPESDRSASQVPLDREYWSDAIPALSDLFERVASSPTVFHHPVSVVSCTSWSAGRVALLGDAAHAMPPDFGQGANLAIDIGYDLVSKIDGGGELETGLLEWERMTRPRADMVQMLSAAYNFIGYQCPPSLVRLRTLGISAIARMPMGKSRWDFYWRGGHPKPGSNWMQPSDNK